MALVLVVGDAGVGGGGFVASASASSSSQESKGSGLVFLGTFWSSGEMVSLSSEVASERADTEVMILAGAEER